MNYIFELSRPISEELHFVDQHRVIYIVGFTHTHLKHKIVLLKVSLPIAIHLDVTVSYLAWSNHSYIWFYCE